ncbi:unnamed protein product, partial [Mesorhabditis spiculigera]
MAFAASAELTNLSWLPFRPCWLLRWPNVTIMLDCALDYSSLANFLPQIYGESHRLKKLGSYCEDVPCLKAVPGQSGAFVDGLPEVHPAPLTGIQMDKVDAILVSNPQSLIALPFYTEETGFSGSVYATDPTIQFGRMMAEECIEYYARCTTEEAPAAWKRANLTGVFPLSPYRHGRNNQIHRDNPIEWTKFYTAEQLEKAIDRVTVVSFRETVSILGMINATTYGNGYTMGSCNWMIANEMEKIVYISAACLRHTHTKAVDWDSIGGADRLILTSLSTSYRVPQTLIVELLKETISTLRNGGNVLFPILPTGLIFDLIAVISEQMTKQGISLDVPIYFISPVGKRTLAFANVNSEYVSVQYQEKIWTAEEPFNYAALLKCGRLQVYDSLYGDFSREVKSPCVCFAGHPSLRIGDAAHLLEVWGNDSKNAVIITEPDFPLADVCAPFDSLAIRKFDYVIDTRLDYPQANTALAERLKPTMLYVPDYYHLRKDLNGAYLSYNPMLPIHYEETIKVSDRPRRKRVLVHPELVRRLEIVGNEKNPSVGYGQLRGFLNAYDNAFEILPAKRDQTLRPRYCGKLDADTLKVALDRRQIAHTISTADGKTVVTTEKPQSRVTIHRDGLRTNVEADADDDRNRMLDVIASCLKPVP